MLLVGLFFSICPGLMLFDWILVILIFAGPASFGCVEPRVVQDVKPDISVNTCSGCNDEKNLLYVQYVFIRLIQFHLLLKLARS